jgi:hypothetical protein
MFEIASRPALVTGSPWKWSVELGFAGAMVPVATQLGLAGALGPWVVPAALAMGATSALCGLVAPLALDWFRRGVPLWLLVVLASTVGAFAGWSAGALVDIAPVLRLWYTAVAALVCGAGWLPYTMATVLRRPTWPVVAAGLLVALSAAWLA